MTHEKQKNYPDNEDDVRKDYKLMGFSVLLSISFKEVKPTIRVVAPRS